MRRGSAATGVLVTASHGKMVRGGLGRSWEATLIAGWPQRTVVQTFVPPPPRTIRVSDRPTQPPARRARPVTRRWRLSGPEPRMRPCYHRRSDEVRTLDGPATQELAGSSAARPDARSRPMRSSGGSSCDRDSMSWTTPSITAGRRSTPISKATTSSRCAASGRRATDPARAGARASACRRPGRIRCAGCAPARWSHRGRAWRCRSDPVAFRSRSRSMARPADRGSAGGRRRGQAMAFGPVAHQARTVQPAPRIASTACSAPARHDIGLGSPALPRPPRPRASGLMSRGVHADLESCSGPARGLLRPLGDPTVALRPAAP